MRSGQYRNWDKEPITESEVVEICKRINPNGEGFRVHRFKYSSEKNRQVLHRMRRAGVVKQVPCENPFLEFCLPEFYEKVKP